MNRFPKDLHVHAVDAAGQVKMGETEGSAPLEGVTPIENHFVIHHYDSPLPISPDEWSLTLRMPDGAESAVTMHVLKELKSKEVDVLAECAGNGRKYLEAQAPGTQFGRGLVSTATWTGVPLTEVLAWSGLDQAFNTMVVRARDAGVAQPENEWSDFAKGLPSEKALDPDTILAFAMNGEPVPHIHGGPVRLVVPGWYGVWWVKWPTEIICTDGDFAGFWQSKRYTYQAGEYETPRVVGEILPRATVESPGDGDSSAVGIPIQVSGRCWAGPSGVRTVEVSIDRGANWVPAEIEQPKDRWSSQRWSAEVVPSESGPLEIAVRAVDGSDRVQPLKSKANRLGYGNNDIQLVQIRVTSG